ncbi:Do/DeqQ family serine protease [Saccharicrinis carchari]|uniref:Do/DeqQ family serine protease n=1 Tax=Saccharicrinis carchari TaxID=1168039 RepID=A0A521B836_SACCC|nr:Do family serine endopeptidase [Saccharicrinis carchari]SMO43254.1 Do/DeqQ family serine protease [Saccharicrinis carchari]
MKVKKLFFVFLAAVLGAVLGVYAYVLIVNPQKEIVTVENHVVPAARYASLGQAAPVGVPDFTLAAEKSVEAVVHVMTKATRSGNAYSHGNPFYDFFFGPRGGIAPDRAPVMGSGSGVIIAEDGYIITNNHVIDKADEIEVVLNDRRSYKAKLIGADPTTDIALLKIDEKGLRFLAYGDSDDLKIGEWVLAVGNPFNLTSTVTAGIVSAKARSINILSNRSQPMGIESFIQTDAAVNPGNSGGALVNIRGELVGINTAIASQTGSFAGYSFAVPVGIAKKVVADLKEFGEVQRGFIGVQIRGVDAALSKELNLDKIEGVYVDAVTANGGAAVAGVKKGDVILSINGVAVNTNSELIGQVSKHRPGDKVSLSIKRDGKVKQFTVVLRNSYGSTEVVRQKEGISALLGAELRELSDQQKNRLLVDYGMEVVKLTAGKFKQSGIREGFIILKANRQPIKTITDLKDVIATTDGGLFITGVYPNGQVTYYAINLQE